MKTKELKILFLLFTIYYSLFTGVTGCGKKKTKPVGQVVPTQVVPTLTPATKPKPTKPERTLYVYQGHRSRDPFIPLTGTLATSRKGSEKLTARSLRAFSVKGIIEDKKGKIALLSAPGGRNYMLKEGKLIDPEGKIVPEITGMIEKNKITFFLAEENVELNIMEESKR